MSVQTKFLGRSPAKANLRTHSSARRVRTCSSTPSSSLNSLIAYLLQPWLQCWRYRQGARRRVGRPEFAEHRVERGLDQGELVCLAHVLSPASTRPSARGL